MKFDNYLIRPVTPQDAATYFHLVESNRARISTYFPGIVSVTNTPEEAANQIAERIAGADKGKYMIHLIMDTDKNIPIGVIQLKDIDFNARKREFGFFVDGNYEKRGIATRSISLACEYCFKTLDLNKVFMRIAEENTASRRVAEKCGFKVEGILRNDFMTTDGKLIDIFYYGLLKNEMP